MLKRNGVSCSPLGLKYIFCGWDEGIGREEWVYEVTGSIICGSLGCIISSCKVSISTNSGSMTLGSNVSRASTSTYLDSPIGKDVILGLVLMGNGDFGWLNSDMVLEGVAFEALGSIVCVFLFLRWLGVSSGGKWGNICILHEWRGCLGHSSMTN